MITSDQFQVIEFHKLIGPERPLLLQGINKNYYVETLVTLFLLGCLITNRNADVLSNLIYTKLCVLRPTKSANHETTQLIINSHFYLENEYSTG